MSQTAELDRTSSPRRFTRIAVPSAAAPAAPSAAAPAPAPATPEAAERRRRTLAVANELARMLAEEHRALVAERDARRRAEKVASDMARLVAREHARADAEREARERAESAASEMARLLAHEHARADEAERRAIEALARCAGSAAPEPRFLPAPARARGRRGAS